MERLAQRSFHGAFPTGVDLDEIEQGSEHTIHTGEMFGSGTSASALQSEMQGLGSCPPTTELFCCTLPRADHGVVRRVGRDAPGLGSLHTGNEFGLDGLRRLDLVLQTLALGIEPSGALLERLQPSALAAQIGIRTLDARPHGTQFATDLGCG